MATEIFTWEDDARATHSLIADIVLGSKDERTSEATDHPVENGADITDHVRQLPDRLTLEIGQTQTPIEPIEGFSDQQVELQVRKSLFQPGGLLAVTSAVGAAADAIVGAITGKKDDVLKTLVLVADSEVDRVNEAHDKLIEVKQKAYPVTFTFKGRVYPNFLVTMVGLSRNAGEAGFGRFTVEARSFRTVETGAAELPDPADLRAKAASKRGKKPSKALSDAEEEVVKKSLLSQGLDSVLGGF